MWLSLNKGFLSIVDKAKDPECLLVRSRVEQHLKNYFPDAEIVKTIGNDYLFRAEIPRTVVAEMLVKQVTELDYSNFKDSVRDNELHHAYASVWNIMARLQPIAPYSRGSRR